jgi:hypothetical protein
MPHWLRVATVARPVAASRAERRMAEKEKNTLKGFEKNES